MALGTDSTCDPVSWLSTTVETMAMEPVSTTIRAHANLTTDVSRRSVADRGQGGRGAAICVVRLRSGAGGLR